MGFWSGWSSLEERDKPRPWHLVSCYTFPSQTTQNQNQNIKKDESRNKKMGIDGVGQQSMVLAPAGSAPVHQNPNPIEQITERIRGVETNFRSWLARQPIAVEAAITTATGALQGAAIGGLMGTLTPSDAIPPAPPQAAGSLNPQAMASLKQAQVLFLNFFLLFHLIIIFDRVNCMN